MERDFKNLNKLQEVQYNAILNDNKARSVRLRPIKEEFKDKHIYEIWEMQDYQIAKVGFGDNIYYAPFLNYENLHEYAPSFDRAVLICLARKYDGYNDSAWYASRVFGMPIESPETVNDEK